MKGAINMNVIVYSTPTCPYCVMAKDYLNEKNIPFENVDISGNPARAKEMIQKSGQRGVPVIDVDGTIIVGFDRNRLETLLSK